MPVRTPLRIVLCAFIVAGLFDTPPADAQTTTYRFAGRPFEDVSGVVLEGSAITGWFTVVGGLPDGNLAGRIVDYYFVGPLRSYSPFNSEMVRSVMFTDTDGAALSWAFSVYEIPRTNAVGEFYTGIDFAFYMGTGPPGCSLGPGCSASSLAERGGRILCNTPGPSGCLGGTPEPGSDWGLTLDVADGAQFLGSTISQSPGATVPALGTVGLTLLVLGLLSIGLFRASPRLS